MCSLVSGFVFAVVVVAVVVQLYRLDDLIMAPLMMFLWDFSSFSLFRSSELRLEGASRGGGGGGE